MTEDHHSRRLSPLRRLVWLALSLAFLAALAGFFALRHFRFPAPTGPYPVGTMILDLTDTGRHEEHSSDPGEHRQLVAQLWYPATPSNAPLAAYQRWKEATRSALYTPFLQTNSRWNAPVAPGSTSFPVLLFGHRWNGQRVQNTDLAEELASHGYVVVAIDHPYNSALVELGDGRVIKGTEVLEGPKGYAASAAEQIDYWNTTLDVWAQDDLFVLNQLAIRSSTPSDIFYHKLDTDHTGAFGHSFGGAVSLKLCGLDPRIKAAVNLDGWTFGALQNRTAQQPILIEYEQITAERKKQLATLTGPGTVGDQLDRADFAAVDRSIGPFGGSIFYVAGTQHMDFTDQPLLPPLHRVSATGPIAPAEIEGIVRETVVAFFNQSLKHTPAPLLNDPHHRFKEVTAEDSRAPRIETTGVSHPAQP